MNPHEEREILEQIMDRVQNARDRLVPTDLTEEAISGVAEDVGAAYELCEGLIEATANQKAANLRSKLYDARGYARALREATTPDERFSNRLHLNQLLYDAKGHANKLYADASS